MTIESVLPRPNIFDAKRILCIQPHYDDNDIGAGGTRIGIDHRHDQELRLRDLEVLQRALDSQAHGRAPLAEEIAKVALLTAFAFAGFGDLVTGHHVS